EHIVYWYVNEFYNMSRGAIGVDEEGMKRVMQEKDTEARQILDQLLADLSKDYVGPRAQQLFGALPPIIQQAQQYLASLGPQGMPQMPVDPNKMAAIEQKRESDQLKAQTEQQKIAARREEKIIDLQG